MINESKQISMEQFLIDQAREKDIVLDTDKVRVSARESALLQLTEGDVPR